MTIEQKNSILSAYNQAVDDMRTIDENELLDSKNPVISFRANNAHSFALGRQAGIDLALDILGYGLVINDEDYAIDIVELE